MKDELVCLWRQSILWILIIWVFGGLWEEVIYEGSLFKLEEFNSLMEGFVVYFGRVFQSLIFFNIKVDNVEV